MVNHKEHNDDVSFAASIHPTEQLSMDFNYAHDNVFSQTNLCYIFTATANATLPSNAYNMGTARLRIARWLRRRIRLYLGTGNYSAPSNFVSGTVNYALRRICALTAAYGLTKWAERQRC